MTENQKFTITWGIVSLIVVALFTFNNNSHLVETAGVLIKIVAIIVGTATGLIGAFIGEALRRYALPEGFFTTVGMDSIIKIKP